MAGRGADGMGTVRPLAQSISVEQAEMAATKVREAVAQQQEQVSELEKFLSENEALKELVLELPDVVSRPIMVPFGKAAFFPGRLIHTNEFTVLLGGNLLAERSSKQTAEFLSRRSEFLEKKIAGVKAHIDDLEVEASFITNTADEAKAGLVEIREEYKESIEEHITHNPRTDYSGASASKTMSMAQDSIRGHGSDEMTSSNRPNLVEDKEHELLMARLSELELAEAAAGNVHDEGEEGDSDEDYRELDDNDDREHISELGSNQQRAIVSRSEDINVEESIDGEDSNEEDSSITQDESDDDIDADDLGLSEEEHNQALNVDNSTKSKDETLQGMSLSRFARETSSGKAHLATLDAEQHVLFQKTSSGQYPSPPDSATSMEMSSKRLEKPVIMSDLQKELQEWRKDSINSKGHVLAERHENSSRPLSSLVQKPNLAQGPSGSAAIQLKAFPGTIMERGYAAPSSYHDQQVRESQPSRPISKFKVRNVEAGTSTQDQQIEEPQPSRPISKFKMRHSQGGMT